MRGDLSAAAGEGILAATRAGLIEWREDQGAPSRRVFFQATFDDTYLYMGLTLISINGELHVPIPEGLREAAIEQQGLFGEALLERIASWATHPQDLSPGVPTMFMGETDVRG